MPNLSTSYTFTGDNLPEDHPLSGYEWTFDVTAEVEPYSPQTWDEPAAGGNVNILEASLIKLGRLLDHPPWLEAIEIPEDYTPKRRKEFEEAFLKLVEEDEKLRDRVETTLFEVSQEPDYPEYE